MAAEEEMYEKSWILRHIMDRWVGSKEIVAARRKLTLVRELVENSETKSQLNSFATGSMGEGFLMEGSDHDVMFTYKHVIVLCPDHEMTSSPDIKNILMVRDAKSRPGYVTLELDVRSQAYHPNLIRSMVPVGDRYFISSEMFQALNIDRCRRDYQLNVEAHGPAANILHENSKVDFDFVTCFKSPDWPKEANEWISRPRLHGWPDPALRNEIVHEGCQLVPMGDKTSADTFLQWRISFVTSERKLIFSLNHIQFLVYGLLKYVLKQISETMEQLVGQTDILTSYIIKTVIFYAVESTPNLLWQEKHIFYCFMWCLSILIAWVKAGFCPNYFISENNMFLGKVHGENQQQLLRFLIDLHNKKWGCLSVGTFMQPSLGQVVNEIRALGSPDIRLPPPASLERKLDATVFNELALIYCPPDAVPVMLKLLLESKSDIDEFLAYTTATEGLSNAALETFGDHKDFRGNKDKIQNFKEMQEPAFTTC
ncbi:uncharacterized protein [Argopecten irradians]|uniref:uncharacterized protein n=1 Tax=Argopecten irradians TaxID=31199 RepID=UPI0037200842